MREDNDSNRAKNFWQFDGVERQDPLRRNPEEDYLLPCAPWPEDDSSSLYDYWAASSGTQSSSASSSSSSMVLLAPPTSDSSPPSSPLCMPLAAGCERGLPFFEDSPPAAPPPTTPPEWKVLHELLSLPELQPLVDTLLRTAGADASSSERPLVLRPPARPHMPKAQFLRTKICPFQLRGYCMNQEKCCYAHSQEELQPLPDLRKTKLCETVKKGLPCQRLSCTYAHSISELKPSPDLATYKTSPCFFWKKARCFNGSKCRFAHGDHELRPKLAKAQRDNMRDL